LVTDRVGEVGWGGNSGFQALNLAVQFGARKIVLVGFDLNLDQGVHWHGPHPGRLNNPTRDSLARWARVLDAQAPLLERLGVEVVNASPASALTKFRKVPFEEALAC
jgi:sugar phosphate isomerase/epimerase